MKTKPADKKYIEDRRGSRLRAEIEKLTYLEKQGAWRAKQTRILEAARRRLNKQVK